MSSVQDPNAEVSEMKCALRHVQEVAFCAVNRRLTFAMFGPSSRSEPRPEQTFLRASLLFIVNLVEYLFFLLGKMGSLP